MKLKNLKDLNLSPLQKTLIFKVAPITLSFFTAILGVGIIFWFTGQGHISHTGLAASNRTMNAFFGALVTAIVLIITLTSNTFTPRLSKIFVHHPLTISGMGIVLLSNMVVILGNLLSPEHPFYIYMLTISFVTSVFMVAGIVPYLYYVSQFIRPKYFLPLLENLVVDKIKILDSPKGNREVQADAFDNLDVIFNIASTASKRGDKQLTIQVFESTHTILAHLIDHFPNEKKNWRIALPQFLPGVSEEAKFYLEKEKVWPESYILGKTLRILIGMSKNQNEIISVVCERLLETLDECVIQDRNNLIELHIMFYNTLLSKSIEENNLERFQSLCYYHRLAIELLVNNEDQIGFATASFIRYGNIASKNGAVWKETVLFDLGRIILFFAYDSEELGISFWKNHASLVWKKELPKEGKWGEIAWNSLAKTYWEARGKGFEELSTIIGEGYLNNVEKHSASLEYLFGKTHRPLHWEFNDRLFNLSFMSVAAKEKANKWYEDYKKSQNAI